MNSIVKELKPSVHPERGMDFHLRMLKITDRADWDITSIDARTLETEMASGRPDWIVRRKDRRRYKVVDYKNRNLGNGKASAYEVFQVVIYAVLLAEMVFRESGQRPVVEAQLLYADGEMVTAKYTEQDELWLLERSLEARTKLYGLGLHNDPDERPTVTKLARLLVDPTFSDPKFGWTLGQVVGEVAHESMKHLGPRVLH